MSDDCNWTDGFDDGYVQGQVDLLCWAGMTANDRAQFDPLGSFDSELRGSASMLLLARNLRDAAGCALAFGLGDQSRYVPGGLGWMPLDEYWGANLDGRAAPGWER